MNNEVTYTASKTSACAFDRLLSASWSTTKLVFVHLGDMLQHKDQNAQHNHHHCC
jgi:hypothetical protein